MTFEDAVKRTVTIQNAYRRGLQALREADRNKIDCAAPRRLSGSIDLDAVFRPLHPHDPVWDYGIGWREPDGGDRVFWLEVHPANSAHVDEVLRKLDWLRRWLSDSAPVLDQLERVFVWVASGAVALPQNSPQRKKIAARGLHFAGRRFVLPLKTR